VEDGLFGDIFLNAILTDSLKFEIRSVGKFQLGSWLQVGLEKRHAIVKEEKEVDGYLIK